MDNWEWWIRVVEIPIIGGIVAWIANTRTQISDHRLHVAEQYAPREDLRNMEKRLTAQLDRIERRINGSPCAPSGTSSSHY